MGFGTRPLGCHPRSDSTDRDSTFNEDKSTLRAGTALQAMAIIRNTILAAFRFAGWTNLKKARRHFSHGISWCVDLITKPVKTVKYQT